MNKTAPIERIKTHDGLTNDEKSALLGLIRSYKKYGLISHNSGSDKTL